MKSASESVHKSIDQEPMKKWDKDIISALWGRESVSFISSGQVVQHQTQNQKEKHKRWFSDWAPEALVCKRFGISNPSIAQTLLKPKPQQWLGKAISLQNTEFGKLDQESKTDQAAQEFLQTTDLLKHEQIQDLLGKQNINDRPPVDLFKAIFENQDSELSSSSDSDTKPEENMTTPQQQQDFSLAGALLRANATYEKLDWKEILGTEQRVQQNIVSQRLWLVKIYLKHNRKRRWMDYKRFPVNRRPSAKIKCQQKRKTRNNNEPSCSVRQFSQSSLIVDLMI
eukprot:TRINITY_DN48387_c1_g1_i4.p2 TRINITY_DN48387_c1_g1~~TRINITY_DN48387_c1_g1_i4.p2  ORF type:complete len:283 (-),score=12.95 TRINITY_DN48387_c1_g1_i4:199-1047(-)